MEWVRSEDGPLHRLQVYKCPIEVLAELSQVAAVDVTVENVRPVRSIDKWFESTQAVHPGGRVESYIIRNASFDIALNNADFLGLMKFWDTHGVYAVFTERSPVAFKASRLDPPARYRALANFGFVLEFALAGPASAGWSQIVTRREDMIVLAEELLGQS